jgi:hypothetical protein
MFTGLLQRLPYLLAGIALLVWGNTNPLLALIIVALTPFLSGSIGGTNVSAYLEFVLRAIPTKRLASKWSFRLLIVSLIGIPAGFVVKQVLTYYPGSQGYAMLHFLTFGGLMVSFFIFAFSKEIKQTDTEKSKPGINFFDTMASVPRLLKEEPQVFPLIGAHTLFNGIYFFIPFLAIHTIYLLHKDEYFLGFLVASQMAGGIIGNLLSAYLGDKFGHL